MSSPCTHCRTSRSGSGSTGSSPGRVSQAGRNGPANSRRISGPASRLKISPGRRRTTRNRGFAALDGVERALGLRLVARVEQRVDAFARPRLVDRSILRAGRVHADRRGVHERLHAGPRRGLEHAPRPLDVHARATHRRRGSAGSATRGGSPRRRRRNAGPGRRAPRRRTPSAHAAPATPAAGARSRRSRRPRRARARRWSRHCHWRP